MSALDVVATRVRRLMTDVPDAFSGGVPGSPPPGMEFDLAAILPEHAVGFCRERLVPAIAELESTLPLVREPDAGIWEGLAVSVREGRAFLVARNHMGHGERLHTFELDRSRHLARTLPEWFAARGTPRADTSWDEARGGRVVMVEDTSIRPRPSYVDPGAVRLIEIALAAGATTLFSCEGHPLGGYLVVKEDAAGTRLAEALSSLGWAIRPWHRGITCDMPRPRDFPERDAAWRGTCAGLERLLGLPRDAGRDRLAELNLHQAACAVPAPRP